MVGRILIADPVSTNRISLVASLRRAHHDFATAHDAHEALGVLRSLPIDVVLVSDDLTGLPLPEFLEKLTDISQPVTRPPVIVIASGRDPEHRLRLLRAGADDVISKPLEETCLLARIRGLLRSRETDRALSRREVTVQDFGFAESSPTFESAARIALIGAPGLPFPPNRLAGLPGGEVFVTDRDGALDEAGRGNAAEVFVLGASGARRRADLNLIPELRSRAGSRHAAILVSCDPSDLEGMVMALDLGANDVVPSDATAEELGHRIAVQLGRKRKADRLRSSVDEGLRLAMEDPLTGLYNRRYAMAHLERLAKGSAVGNRDFAVMIADIDRFKQINDQRGHAAGDAVLTAVAHRLRDNLRGIDMIARIGGEEFLIAMPEISLQGAVAAARRLCLVVGETPIDPGGPQPPIEVTVSIGLAIRASGSVEPIPSLLERADAALYRAKAEGRNQVNVSRDAA